MKVFVFVRGPDTELKREVIRELTSQLDPGSYINVSLGEYNTDNKKEAHRMSKNTVREFLQWESPYCFLINNPSLNPPDWDSYLSLATPDTVSIGIDVYSPEDCSNLQLRNVREFIVSVYKYLCVKLNEDISGVVRETLRVIRRGEVDAVYGRRT